MNSKTCCSENGERWHFGRLAGREYGLPSRDGLGGMQPRLTPAMGKDELEEPPWVPFVV